MSARSQEQETSCTVLARSAALRAGLYPATRGRGDLGEAFHSTEGPFFFFAALTSFRYAHPRFATLTTLFRYAHPRLKVGGFHQKQAIST